MTNVAIAAVECEFGALAIWQDGPDGQGRGYELGLDEVLEVAVAAAVAAVRADLARQVEAAMVSHEYDERSGSCLGCGFRDDENGWLSYADHCRHVATAVREAIQPQLRED